MSYEKLTGEARLLVQKIEENCELLTKGWSEKVDYSVPVVYHRVGCRRSGVCQDCEVKTERRSKQVSHPGLLKQLKEYQKSCDTNRNPQAARGAPRVKTPKMHPELRGFFTLDEITCDAYSTLDRVYEEGGRDRGELALPIRNVFEGLTYQVAQFAEERPDLARQVMKATDKWVAQARQALNHSVSDAMFADTVCGNCGGGLTVAWDNSSDVKCVGTPSAAPCGETYPMSEWLNLYEKGRKNA